MKLEIPEIQREIRNSRNAEIQNEIPEIHCIGVVYAVSLGRCYKLSYSATNVICRLCYLIGALMKTGSN